MLSRKTLANEFIIFLVVVILLTGCQARIRIGKAEIPNTEAELVDFIEIYKSKIETKNKEIDQLRAMTPEIMKIQQESQKTWNPSHALQRHKTDIEWAYDDLEDYEKTLIEATSKYTKLVNEK